MLRVKAAWRGGVFGRPGWFLELHLDDNWEQDIAELKRRVPATDRAWDEEAKRWWVAAEHEEELAKFIGGFEAYLHQMALPGLGI